MTSNAVLQLQKRLGVKQTAYFGPLTLAAVMIYQRAHAITPTGYVGPLTRAALNTTS
jgi:peptidoglycan hydrolase-like protein with peptidoglycan-binding domain